MLHFFDRFSIRVKVWSSSAIVLLLISTFTLYYFPAHYRATTTEALRARVQGTAEMVALGVGIGLEMKDYGVVSAAVNWAKQDPALAYLVVVDTAGEAFARLGPDGLPRDLRASLLSRQITQRDGMLELAVPVRYRERLQGTLLLGISLAPTEVYLRHERATTLLITLVGLVVGSAVSLFFAKRITGPIVALRATADRVAAGDYSTEPSIDSRDEVGALATALGAMVRRVREAIAQLGLQAVELETARDAALAATRTKSEFLATMSHELRTPMNGLLGMLWLLKDSELNAQQRDFAATAHRSADSLLGIINDVLDYSKIEAGKVELEVIDLDLRATLDEVVVHHAERAFAKGLTLVSVVALETPTALLGDPGRVRQVLMNLVGNAIKFTERGEIVVRLGAVEDTETHAVLSFEVTDSGIGMTEAERVRLFQPFAQADVSTTRRFGGTGLGLAISRQLVTAMGGEIDVRTEVGKGSTFSFTIRVQKGATTEQPLMAPRVLTPLRATRRAQVLVVDDNAVNRKVATALLERMGHRVDVATNGLEAVDAVFRQPYDIVLMDCQMPELDGFGATAAIRRREPPGLHVPIVAMTANALAGDRERCLASGMDDYMPKPVRPDTLAAMVERWLPAACALPVSALAESVIGPAMAATPSGEPAVVRAIEASAFDLSEMLERVEGDRDLLLELAAMFRDERPRLLSDIRRSVEQRDARGLERAAHSLKGACANMSAKPTANAAHALEMLGRAARFDDVTARLAELEVESSRLDDALLSLAAVSA